MAENKWQTKRKLDYDKISGRENESFEQNATNLEESEEYKTEYEEVCSILENFSSPITSPQSSTDLLSSLLIQQDVSMSFSSTMTSLTASAA